MGGSLQLGQWASAAHSAFSSAQHGAVCLLCNPRRARALKQPREGGSGRKGLGRQPAEGTVGAQGSWQSTGTHSRYPQRHREVSVRGMREEKVQNSPHPLHPLLPTSRGCLACGVGSSGGARMEEHGSPTQDVYLPALPLGSGSSLCSDLRSSPGWELAWWVMALFPHGSWACRSSLLF